MLIDTALPPIRLNRVPDFSRAAEEMGFNALLPAGAEAIRLGGNGEELSRLAARGDWVSLPEVITDDVLESFLTAASRQDLGAALHQRYKGIVDRINLPVPFQPGGDDDGWRQLVPDVRDAC